MATHTYTKYKLKLADLIEFAPICLFSKAEWFKEYVAFNEPFSLSLKCLQENSWTEDVGMEKLKRNQF